ncbi:hypothetical protein BsWGS_01621 [Bradybaena similaris]
MSSSDSDEKRPLLHDPGLTLAPGKRQHVHPAAGTSEYKSEVPGLGAPQIKSPGRKRSSRLSLAIEGSGHHNIALSWTGISVTVKVPGKRSLLTREYRPPQEKLILKEVTGVANPGCLLAIMGASGSGKSTLLNVLTSRNTRDYEVQGEIHLNGVPLTGTNIRNISAYVQQSDIFIHTLTVRETLAFRALLRMDKRLDKRARLARVEEVILEMGLTGCANSRIGLATGTKKGISGGERKRLAFASEALTNPPIFFCDEPTSSLDTFMAQSIVQTLQKMASRGRVILCTIHQPSSELFAMFSQVLLLAEGKVAYMGSTQGALDFFTRLEFPCPRNFNPADHYILTLAIVPGEEDESRQRTKTICNAYKDSHYYRNITDEIDQYIRESDMSDHIVLNEVTGDSRYTSSLSAQVINLFWRSWTAQYRDDLLFWTRLMQTVVMAVMLGLIYFDLDVDQKGVSDVNGAIFIVVTMVSMTNMFPVLTSFPQEMSIAMREYGTGLYRIDAYFFTKTVAELPLFVMCTLLFVGVTYWMIGLNDSFEAFAVTCGISLYAGLVCVNIGYLISVVTGDTTLALSLASPILIPFMIFGGPFMNGDSTPDYFVWLDALSWFKYSYEIIMIKQWDDLDYIECQNKTVLTNSSTPGICNTNKCLFRNGDEVLDYYSMNKDDVGEDLAILSSICGGIYLLAFISMMIRAKVSKE